MKKVLAVVASKIMTSLLRIGYGAGSIGFQRIYDYACEMGV